MSTDGIRPAKRTPSPTPNNDGYTLTESKKRLFNWQLPPDDHTCIYPDFVFDPSLNFTRNGACARLNIKHSLRPATTCKTIARAWIEDRTLFKAISCGLVRVPLHGQHYSLKDALTFEQDPDFNIASTNIDLVALSYVHQTSTSTYGLAKVPEPVERALIEGIRRRAKHANLDAVFVWSDQTIKGHVDDQVWLKVGVYAYAVLSGLVLPTHGYTSRLWPTVECSLLTSCNGFVIDATACSACPKFDFATIRVIVPPSSHAFLHDGDIDVIGHGNTPRDGMAIMATHFLSTRLATLDTHYQTDRQLLRDISVSFLKSQKGHSIGHHLLCPTQCKYRNRGGVTDLLSSIGSRGFLSGADFTQGSALWDTEPIANPELSVFPSQNGFIDTVHNVALSSERRSLLNVEGVDQVLMAIRRLACKFSFSSTAGYEGVLWVVNLSFGWDKDMRSLDSDMPYWSSPRVLAWIELESNQSGNRRWPGASVKLDQPATAEIDTLLRLHCRFYRRAGGENQGGHQTALKKQGEKVMAMMRNQLKMMPGIDVNGTLLQQMNAMGLDGDKQESLLDEELLDIIGQEIERHGMVPSTGALHLKENIFERPYNDIKCVNAQPGNLQLVIEKNFDPEKQALHWIFVEDKASKAREVIGICGRLCMSALYGSVSQSEFSRFLNEANPFLVARNRAIGKRHASARFRYVQENNGMWRGRENWSAEHKSVAMHELPEYAMVVYDD